MKKAFDQTVRDLKREVNKKVLKVPGIEQKVLDATSNESWGPHGSLLADIAQATRNYHEYQRVMNVIWKRINDTGKNWRHVYKALMLLEYLVANGSERVIDNIKEHSYHISVLSNFQYIDSSGRDQGSNIRRKSQILLALLNDKEKIQEFRQKNSANRDIHRGSTGRPGSYSDNNDDYFENRYASRDEDPYGNRNKREVGHRDKDDDRSSGAEYGREGDRNSGYADEYYSKDGHNNSDGRGHRNDDYQHDNDTDERYSSRGGGGGADNYPREQEQLGQRLSGEGVVAPPSYEEATRDVEIYMHDDRNGDALVTAAPKVSSPSAPKSNSLSESTDQVSAPFATVDRFPASTNQGLGHPPDDVFFSTNQDMDNGFDEFDPRDSSVSADPPVADSLEMGIFGSSSASDIYSLALTSSSATHNGAEIDHPANSGVGPDFGMMSSAADMFLQPGSNPFEDPPFVASQHSFGPEHNTATGTHFHSSSSTGDSEYAVVPKTETTGFDFDLSFGISYNPVLDGQQSSQTNAGILTTPVTQPNHDISATLTSKDASVPTHESQSVAQTNVQGNFQPQSGNSFGFSYNPASDSQPGPFASPANFTPEAPVSQQSNGFSAMLTGMQASVPTQEFQPAPPTHVQVNPQPQSDPPAPSASQATQFPTFNAHPGTPSNNHIAQADNFSQLCLQTTPAATTHLLEKSDSQPQSTLFGSQLTPFTTLDAHPLTPVNNQTTQMPAFSQHGQHIPPAAPTYGSGNLNPRPQSVPAPFASQSTPFTTLEPHLITPVNSHSTQFNIFPQPQIQGPPAAPTNAQGNLMFHSSIPSQFATQTTTPVNNLTNQSNTFLQPAQQTQPTMDILAPTLVLPPVKGAPSKEKFEARSTVWADTLSRGLVNLDISGPKTNPHADIGIDFDSINRKEKREEKKLTAAPVSTITMGKAMGAGSGIGRTGAGAMSGPPNPMMGMGMMGGAGMGIGPMGGGPGMGIGPMVGGIGMGIGPMGGGGGAGMGMQMGMGGYGGNMGQPMGLGMNPGMNRGMPLRPPMGAPPPGQAGTPGFGYNPMSGMGNYGSQQPYGGSYR